MKKVLATILALMMLFALTGQAAMFTDMDEHWSKEYVEKLAEAGIVRGYEDGSFQPEKAITNQEAFTLFARVIGVNDPVNAQAVADAQVLYASVAENYNTYAKKELCFLLYRGILTTEEVGDYLSEETKQEPMKRHEAAKLITRILNGEEEVASAVMFIFDYTDADTFPSASKGYIDYVTKNGIMSGMGDNTFSPNTGVTRAQVAVMLDRTINKLNLQYITGIVSEATESGLTVNGESFEMPVNVIVHKDGVAATVAELESGDAVVITKTYQGFLSIDVVKQQEPEITVKTVEGTIVAIHIAQEMPYIVVQDAEAALQNIYLTMDMAIAMDEKSGNIYDLLLGHNVIVSMENDTITSMEVTNVTETKTLIGKIILVNETFGFVNVSTVDSETGENITKQIFVNDKTMIYTGSNVVVALSALTEGDSVYVTGSEKIGAFEADTIIVTNK